MRRKIKNLIEDCKHKERKARELKHHDPNSNRPEDFDFPNMVLRVVEVTLQDDYFVPRHTSSSSRTSRSRHDSSQRQNHGDVHHPSQNRHRRLGSSGRNTPDSPGPSNAAPRQPRGPPPPPPNLAAGGSSRHSRSRPPSPSSASQVRRRRSTEYGPYTPSHNQETFTLIPNIRPETP